jgi:DNA-binding MarR family transcriptional regulator
MEFENLPLYWVNRLSAMARRELTQRFRAAGHNISPEEWAILMLLWQRDGQSPGAMSGRTVRDPTTMTRLVDGLVRKGLVARRQDDTDRRRSLVCLSARGRDMQAPLVALAMPMIARALDGVSAEDAATTVRVLSRMVENLAAKGGGAMRGD